MNRWQRFLFYQTRNPVFLWTLVIGVLALGLSGAVAANLLRSGPTRVGVADALGQPGGLFTGLPRDDDPARSTLEARLRQPVVKVRAVLDALPGVADDLSTEQTARLRSVIAAARLRQADRRIMTATLNSLLDSHERPGKALRRLAGVRPVIPHANYALGVYWLHQQDLAQAAAAFEQEGTRPDAKKARERAVELYMRVGTAQDLDRLMRDPRYARQFGPAMRLEIAGRQNDWSRVLTLIPAVDSRQVESGLGVLACFAALIWLIFCVQASQIDSIRSGRVGLCLLAVLAGVASAMATLFLVIWQEQVLHWVETRDLAGGLLFFIGGVGLREEGLKLLFFAPLVPLLVRRGNGLEMLIVAGCVGLGFAAEENLQYYHSFGPLTAPGRFLTANFFHIAATGLTGLALCRAVVYFRKGGVNNFLAVFVGVVVVHGLYDALQSLPGLAEVSFASFVCYVALCWQFFREVRELRCVRREVVSLTATFLLGLSCLLAATLIYLTIRMGLRTSVQLLAPSALELAIIAYMILRELPGSLVTV